MVQAYMNVAESYPIYDTVVICEELYGKEKSLEGWFTSFRDFAANEKHVFFKSRTIGSANLAYCNMDSADNLDFVYHAVSLGVRFIAPIAPEGFNEIVVSPAFHNENVIPFWAFDLPAHCGIDFRVQQDVIVENTCIATPPGYGMRGGGGAQPLTDTTGTVPNQTPWKVVTGNNGEPVVDNRFPFPEPIAIPRNTPIEANLYLGSYAKYIVSRWKGPESWVLLTENQAADPPVDGDFFSTPVRFAIQVSLYGYREVQQRGQYHAPGAIKSASGMKR